jgi:glyoxylase-like metal-dependent hydrolase (beta-lactamase superfamily II)
MRTSIVIVVITFMILSLSAAAQQPAELTPVKLSDQIYVLSGAGGNIGIFIGDDSTLVIDAGVAATGEKVAAAVASVSEHPIDFVVNTHWHSDHTGGNQQLAKAGARIVAHKNILKRLSTDQHLVVLERDVPPAPKATWPVVTFDDGLTFHRNGETIEVTHIAGAHSDGDSIVRFLQANVIHTGDIVFYCGYPFIDVAAGGSIDGMIAAVEAIIDLCDEETKVIPGHGEVTNRDGLLVYLGMLQGYRKIIAEQVVAGKDLEAIKSEQSTTELDDIWGKVYFSPEQFTEMVLRSLPE